MPSDSLMSTSGSSRSEAQVSKEAFQERVPELREQLLENQFELWQRADSALLLILAGPGAEAKSSLGNRLCEWLDMRFVETHAFDRPDRVESQMPWLWRYWRNLPAKGGIGLFYGSWYNDVLARAHEATAAEIENSLRRINVFERMLSLEAVRILKVWLDGRPEEADPEDPSVRWQNLSAIVDDWREAANTTFRITSTGHAPWVVLDGDEARARDLAVAEMVLDLLTARDLGATDAPSAASPALERSTADPASFFAFEPKAPISDDKYKAALSKQQARLSSRIRSKAFEQRGLLLVFEGVDAAGKGGTIRRITESLDPRFFRVHPFAAPTSEEQRYPYLWRFWTRLARPGQITIFDRSHYGRLLVERVEEFCTPAEWARGFTEITEFEQQLVDGGVGVLKFWLSISKDEQLARFEDRENTAWKRHKITDEDWRNREKWDAYQTAAVDMIERTHTPEAPWHVVSSEDKRRARVKVLKIINRSLKSLDL